MQRNIDYENDKTLFYQQMKMSKHEMNRFL